MSTSQLVAIVSSAPSLIHSYVDPTLISHKCCLKARRPEGRSGKFMEFKGKLSESEVGLEPQTMQAIRSAFNFFYFLPHHHHFFYCPRARAQCMRLQGHKCKQPGHFITYSCKLRTDQTTFIDSSRALVWM